MSRYPSPLKRYAVAIAAVAAAFSIRYGIYGTLDNRLPFAFFTSATLIAAWYGGLGPGLLAAVSGLMLGDYFFLPSRPEGGTLGEVERTGIGIYAMNAALIVLLFSLLHTRLRDLEHKLKGGGPEGLDSPAPKPGSRGQTQPR